MLRNLRSDRSWFDCSVSPYDERPDVLENPTRPIRLEKELALNLSVGESVRGKERFPGANALFVRVVESGIPRVAGAARIWDQFVLPVLPRYDHHVCFDSDG